MKRPHSGLPLELGSDALDEGTGAPVRKRRRFPDSVDASPKRAEDQVLPAMHPARTQHTLPQMMPQSVPVPDPTIPPQSQHGQARPSAKDVKPIAAQTKSPKSEPVLAGVAQPPLAPPPARTLRFPTHTAAAARKPPRPTSKPPTGERASKRRQLSVSHVLAPTQMQQSGQPHQPCHKNRVRSCRLDIGEGGSVTKPLKPSLRTLQHRARCQVRPICSHCFAI